MSSISVPTSSALPSSQRLPAKHASVVRSLQRLSRPSLLSLVLDWLDERNQDNAAPYLLEEGDEEVDLDHELYPPASSLAELRETYTELQAGKGSRRDLVDRILEGDWRDGISLYQLAMVDMQYLYDHPTSQKWTALKIVRLSLEAGDSSETTSIPRFHPATFLQNLQREVLPDVKAHYNLDRHPTLPLLILRIYIVDSPYNTSLALHSKKLHENSTESVNSNLESSRTFYIAFPYDSPHIYVSLTTTTPSTTPHQGSISDNKSLRKLTLDGIPKAFSRPRERYKLESTSLSARNLEAMCEKRGGGRGNASGGGWGVYAETGGRADNPLDLETHRLGNGQLPSPDPTEIESGENKKGKGKEIMSLKRKRAEDDSTVRRRKQVAAGRFGNSAMPDDGKGIERLDIRLEDPYPTTQANKPLYGEVMPEEEPISDGTKKRKGRRSTMGLELDKTADDIEEDDNWRPDIRLIFQGQHIFAGIRELVEAGIVDGEKMPGWMTGEENVSVGIVRNGRIKGSKGSGL